MAGAEKVASDASETTNLCRQTIGPAVTHATWMFRESKWPDGTSLNSFET